MENVDVLDEIGRGSFGRVFKCKDNLVGDHFALKAIKIDTEYRHRVCEREASMMNQCQHPNVIRLIDEPWVGPAWSDGRVVAHMFIPMELASKSLYGLIRESGRPTVLAAGVIRSIVGQVFKGMAFVHAQGILHRDLKPDNILMSSNGVAKIADFGLSCYERADEKKNPGVGTRHYKSPEMLLGATNYSFAVDRWALGCIIAELHTGEDLFRGNSDTSQLIKMVELLGGITKEEMPIDMELPLLNSVQLPQHGIPGKLEHLRACLDRSDFAMDLVLDLLQYNPDKRLSSEAALKHPFVTGEKKMPPVNVCHDQPNILVSAANRIAPIHSNDEPSDVESTVEYGCGIDVANSGNQLRQDCCIEIHVDSQTRSAPEAREQHGDNVVEIASMDPDSNTRTASEAMYVIYREENGLGVDSASRSASEARDLMDDGH